VAPKKLAHSGVLTVPQNRTIMDEGRGSGDAGGSGDSARVCRSGGLRGSRYRFGGRRDDVFLGRCAAWVDDLTDDSAVEPDEDGDDCARRG